jgi:hypothetical protein
VQGSEFQSALISAEQTFNLDRYGSAIDVPKSLGSKLLDGSNADFAAVQPRWAESPVLLGTASLVALSFSNTNSISDSEPQYSKLGVNATSEV